MLQYPQTQPWLCWCMGSSLRQEVVQLGKSNVRLNSMKIIYTGLILGLRPANERRRYK